MKNQLLLRMACSALVIAGTLGCSSSNSAVEAHPDRFPTKGTLTFNGKPAKGATVTFWKTPLDLKSKDAWRQIRPMATVEADGSYVPNTFESKDGALPGDYVLTVTWTGESTPPGPDRFAGRFSNPENPVAKVTIKRGDNTIPSIDLKGDGVASTTTAAASTDSGAN